MYENNFYRNLKKPILTPPPAVFKWVWSMLYALMFVSFSIIFFSPNSPYKIYAFTLFILQLSLNLIWPLIFFVYRKIKLSLIICILLTLCVFLMILVFYNISKISAILQLPYLIWLIFANILNTLIVKLNSENKI
jgi:tryptophan-rich sensory protein